MSSFGAIILTTWLLMAALVAPSRIHAQTAPSSALPSATAPPTTVPPLDPAKIQDLVQTLEDPTRRAALVSSLRALEAADKAGQTPGAPSQSLIDAIVRFANERADGVVSTLWDVSTTAAQLPSLATWLGEQVGSEFRRDLWSRIAWGVAQALGLGIVAWALARWLVGRADPPMQGGGVRLVLRALLRDLGPPVAFLLTAGPYLDLVAFPPAQRIGHLIIGAVLVDRIGTALFHRLLPTVAATHAARLLRLAARTALYGATALAVAGRLGMPPHFFYLLSNFVFIATAVIGSIATYRARLPIERAVHGWAEWVQSEIVRGLVPFETIAAYGYVTVIGLLWLHYAFWALGVSEGFTFLLRACLLTVGLFLVAQALLLWIDRAAQPEPSMPIGAALADGDPTGDRPAVRRHSPVIRLCRLAIKIVAVLLMLEGWGLGVLSWLASSDGAPMVRVITRVTIVAGIATALWFLVRRIAGAYLEAKDVEGNPVLGNRGRTLTTIARSVILLLIAAMALVSALREIGLDTGPLLAGAGVIGLAVGFGAQTLVKDIINGLFILMGDTIRVGDVVDLGGRSGGVESMNMRAVTLRGYNGDVITVPYSAIDVVTNMTREYSFWVIDIGIAYEESSERVLNVLKEITEQMRREWPWRRLILEPLEVAGLDRFNQSSVGLKARIKTRPGEQWRVGRELNRRVKLRFDEVGIDMPLPQSVVRMTLPPGVDPATIDAAALSGAVRIAARTGPRG